MVTLQKLSKIGLITALCAAAILISFISFMPNTEQYPFWGEIAGVVLGTSLFLVVTLPIAAFIMWGIQRFRFESLNIYTILVCLVMLIYLFVQMAKVGC